MSSYIVKKIKYGTEDFPPNIVFTIEIQESNIISAQFVYYGQPDNENAIFRSWSGASIAIRVQHTYQSDMKKENWLVVYFVCNKLKISY